MIYVSRSTGSSIHHKDRFDPQAQRSRSSTFHPIVMLLFVTYLPELGTDLVTALSGLDVNDFTHIELVIVD